jgi:hypothetical protein
MFDAEPAGLGLFMTPSEQAILHTKESIVTAEPEPLKYKYIFTAL